jgi:hypothetical protein
MRKAMIGAMLLAAMRWAAFVCGAAAFLSAY